MKRSKTTKALWASGSGLWALGLRRLVFSERRQHTVRLESLGDEIPKEPAEFTLVGNPPAVAQSLRERRFEERRVVDRLEHGIDRVACGRGSDARLLDLPPD